MQRPTFNVTEFQEVVHVQMNDAMRHLLVTFISEVDQNGLEAELRALRNALRDPEGALERKLRAGSRRKPYRDNYDRNDYRGDYNARGDYNRVPEYDDRSYNREDNFSRDRYEGDE